MKVTALLLHMLVVPGFNVLAGRPMILNKVLHGDSSPSRYMLQYCLKIGHDSFLLYLSHFIIHNTLSFLI